ncbi:MAG: hypothetical protein WD055_00580 [Candidatus Dependentiae bacterium]
MLRSDQAGDMYNMQIFKVLRDIIFKLHEKCKDEKQKLKLNICGFTPDHKPIYIVKSFDNKELRNPLGKVHFRNQQSKAKKARSKTLRLSEHRLYNKKKEWHDAKKFYIKQQK